ncbi:MAG TPA: tetratricopeptide repeat protein, partial [Pirellulales bacterium]
MPQSHDALLEALVAENFAAVGRCAQELIARDPRQPLVWQSLGVSQLRQNQPEEAAASLERAIELGGDGVELRCELAAALEQCLRFDNAAGHLERAIALDPQSVQAHANLAALLEKLDRTDDALKTARRAITLDPNQPIAHYNLGKILQSQGKIAEAIAAFDNAIELDPQFALARATRGSCRLLVEQYPTGWSDYEWRLQTGQIQLPRFPQPLWTGQPLETGTLLVHSEQGIGDEILFASCLPEVITRVGKCVFICHPRLARLMARSFPAAVVVAQAPAADRAPPKLPLAADFQIPSGSLPMHLRPTAESFPRRKRFLLADPEKRRTWQKQFDVLGPGLKIGISWRGGGTWEERRRRTTTLDQWRAVLEITGAQFINLQYGDCSAELANENRTGGETLHDLPGADPLGDLDEFAAKVAALDLVISIDNATVHLAGALGIPTWCLVPFVPQWRWRLHGEQSPWYPSVQLFRQTKPGDWDGVLNAVAAKLRAEVQSPLTGRFANRESPKAAKAPSSSPTQPAAVTATVATAKPRLICIDSSPASSAALPKSQPQPAVKPGAVNNKHRPSGKTDRKLLDHAIQAFNANGYAEADRLAEQILAINPQEVVALRIRGVAARKVHELDRSVEFLNRGLELASNNAILCFELGVTYLEMNRHRDAYDSLLRAVEINPQLQPACVNICAILELQERFEEALVWAQRAVELKPDCGLANYNLANQLRECGHIVPAIKHYEQSVKLRPDYPKAKWNLGIAYLLLGKFEQAWPLFELRGAAEDVKFDLYPQPRWEGSPLAGKTIVVHAEQGIGDEV